MINLKQWHGQLTTGDSGLQSLRGHRHRLIWHHAVGAHHIGWQMGQEISRC
jgi:hypothetical protein